MCTQTLTETKITSKPAQTNRKVTQLYQTKANPWLVVKLHLIQCKQSNFKLQYVEKMYFVNKNRFKMHLSKILKKKSH